MPFAIFAAFAASLWLLQLLQVRVLPLLPDREADLLYETSRLAASTPTSATTPSDSLLGNNLALLGLLDGVGGVQVACMLVA